jgi:hypothetical protein
MISASFMRRALTIPTLSLVLALSFALGLQGAPMSEQMPVSYTVRFPAPQTHYFDVEALIPTDGQPAVELMMAVWTPGSYMIREFSRNIETISAATEAGAPLSVEKTRKNRWKISARGTARVRVRYRVYAREMSVRTNFVDAGFAILNGAPTFLTRVGAESRPHDVRLVLPPAWKEAVSALPPAPGDAASFRAADFDTLVDSPIYAGNAPVYRFEVDGKPHRLVNEGEDALWDGPRSAADVKAIVREEAAFWGGLPYDRYVFFNLITEASGGLEHKSSTVLMTSRWRARTREGAVGWLGLVAHELFHAWNVKRLRPAALGPFDYENEAYTRDLWIPEGITSYYEDVMVHRAGLSTRKELLKRLSKEIEALQTTPGRQVQSVEDSSFDAWIKYYRQDESSLNSGQLLHQGRRHRFPPRRQDPARHGRPRQPGRRPAPGLRTVLGAARLPLGRFPRRRRGGGGDRSRPLVPPRPRNHRRARLPGSPGLVRPAPRRGREEESRRGRGPGRLAGVRGRDPERETGGDPGEEGHSGL